MSPAWLGYTADAIHVLAGTVWFGGLLATIAVVRLRRRSEEPDGAAAAIAVFSGIAAIAAALVDEVCDRRDVELMAELALPFAARAQCAYLGWPMELADPLITWTQRNHEATLEGDRASLVSIARELEVMVADLIASREVRGEDAPQDLTDALIGGSRDARQSGRIRQVIGSPVRQRSYAMACGYPDGNDAGRSGSDGNRTIATQTFSPEPVVCAAPPSDARPAAPCP